MADHKMFIAWAFERHCQKHHNADFEVCVDPACQVAVEFEQSAQHGVQRTCAKSPEPDPLGMDIDEPWTESP